MVGTSSNRQSPARPLQVAIIGGGITGLVLAIGLQARGVDFTIYERASGFREIGAGFSLSPNARAALKALDPAMLDAFKKVATPSNDERLQWVDGFQTNESVFSLDQPEGGFIGCRRADFLELLVLLVPPEKVQLRKELDQLTVREDGMTALTFKDGSTAVADTVVGCDGIHSRSRQLILGEEDPAAFASYSHDFCFRALVAADKVRMALGDIRTYSRFVYNGPDGHIITYPVAHGAFINVLVVMADPKPWISEGGKTTARGSKSEAVAFFRDWHPSVRAIVDLLPEEMDKWALFDMKDHPAKTYVKGTWCMAGDAAHAAEPHLGSGAGFGIEDCVVLCEVLKFLNDTSESITSTRTAANSSTLEVYNAVRFQRTQWLVKNTREAGDLYSWRFPGCGSDPAKFGWEITKRMHYIWEYDIGKMVEETRHRLEDVLQPKERERRD